jgi:ParB-like chromosome segregation protein Spo0J
VVAEVVETPSEAINVAYYMRVEELKSATLALNTHSDGDMQRLVGVLQEHGVIMPLLYNRRTNTVIDGAGRLEALEASAATHAPVMVVDLDPISEALVRIALLAKYGRRDNETITSLLLWLQGKGVELDATGLKPAEIERLLNPPPKKEKEGKHVACPQCGAEIDLL